MKLFVHRRARRRGLAKALRSELVPGYARSSNGQLHTTVFFYRELK